jgi:hypothetical protein
LRAKRGATGSKYLTFGGGLRRAIPFPPRSVKARTLPDDVRRDQMFRVEGIWIESAEEAEPDASPLSVLAVQRSECRRGGERYFPDRKQWPLCSLNVASKLMTADLLSGARAR